jgi:hypothetical protein
MSSIPQPSATADVGIALPPMPPFLFALLAPYLSPLLAWLSDLCYTRLLQTEHDHPLVQLATTYDPQSVIAQCAAYHHDRGPGAPPAYSVAQLVRAEIVRAYAGSCSSPALAAHLRTNLLARWFVGLPLFGSTPSTDTLERFHTWLCTHHPDALFRDVLAFLDRVDPEDPATTPQIIDTFGMHSPAAAQSPAVVLMRLTARLATHWLAMYPHDTVPVLPPDFDLHRLRTARAARDKAKGQRQLGHAVTTARQVIAAIEPHLDRAAEPLPDLLPPIIAQIEQVIAAETTTDASGQVCERPANQKGSYRIVSATDPEATFRKHQDDTILGYNATISVTATRIRAVLAPTGSTPDSETPELVLKQQQAADQPLPPKLVMDKAGGQGKTRARVNAVSDGNTQMVARLMPAGGADGTRFGPADFQVLRDADGDPAECRCPAGQVTTRFHRSQAGDGVHARFTVAEQCADCALWQQCRPANGKADSHRTVFVSDYHHHQRQAVAFNATEEGQQLLANRWKVEPVVSWLVNYQGCRRARRVGRAAAEGQLYQACAVRNLLLWQNRVKRGQAPPPLGRIAA